MSAEVIPISQLPTELDEVPGQVAWQLETGPYIDDDQIGVNAGRMKSLLRVAGFDGLIVSEFQEDTERPPDTIGIAGVNDDGTAMAAGSAASATPNLLRFNLGQQVDTGLDENYVRPVLSLAINRAGLADEGSDMVQRGLSREQAWARMLDRSLRQGIRRTSVYNMLTETFDSENLAGNTVVNLGSTAGLAGGIAEMVELLPPPPILSTAYVASYGLVLAAEAAANKRATGDTHLRERNWSLLPCVFHPDRIALAGVMSAVPRLVRHVKPASEA